MAWDSPRGGCSPRTSRGRSNWKTVLVFQLHWHVLTYLLGAVLVDGLGVLQLVPFFKSAAGLIHELEDDICLWRRNLLLLETTKPTFRPVLMGCTVLNSVN